LVRHTTSGFACASALGSARLALPQRRFAWRVREH
jgi:hypothetical protein